MQYGYDVQFFDINSNLDYDPCKDPYCFAHLTREIEECTLLSEAVIFLVS